MMNLGHPNWSGKSYRTLREANGPASEYTRSPRALKRKGKGQWVVGVLLTAALIGLALAPLASRAQTIDYAKRSLNKTIVVSKDRTQTVRNGGDGTTIIYTASKKNSSGPAFQQRRDILSSHQERDSFYLGSRQSHPKKGKRP